MTRFNELMIKSEQAKINALKSESNWAAFYWAKVSEELETKALSLDLDNASKEA